MYKPKTKLLLTCPKRGICQFIVKFYANNDHHGVIKVLEHWNTSLIGQNIHCCLSEFEGDKEWIIDPWTDTYEALYG